MSSHPIVAGTDGSSRANVAVDRAGELALALGASVHLVCVPGALEANEWPARISAQQIVAAAAERLQSRGITTETHLPKDQGDAALALVALADHEQAQMIVMGNKGMTGIRRILGSLPNTVSHHARCDVLIVPTQSRSLAEFAGRSIVVGVDGSGGATRAGREAVRLSKALGGELHVVASSKSPAPQESAAAAVAAEAAEQGVSAIAHERDDDPADALLDVADRNDAAIIVVGSKGMRTGERELFGNVPDKISHAGTASVLIVFTGDEAARAGDAMSGVAVEDAGLSSEDASA
jgi:nucleotide-binding universal stress UspA family protein